MTTLHTPSPADILGQPPGRSTANLAPSGNSPLAEEMATEVRRIVRQASEYAPRSRQRRLGPSEIGSLCDRQVIGKLVGAERVNMITDPWPSVVGTAVHAWLADAFDLDNTMGEAHWGGTGTSAGHKQWLTEHKVQPLPERLGGHAGTADLYDVLRRTVWDHKCLGETSMNKVRRGAPPHHYVVQLGLYGMGYMRAGAPVERVGIIAYPRTGSSVDGIYVWETPFDARLAKTVLTSVGMLQERKVFAQAIIEGHANMAQVPITPSDDCFFCPFYRYGQNSDASGCSGRPPIR